MRNIQVFDKSVILGLCLTASAAFAQQGDRVDLGSLQTGATVSFVRTAGGEWGIEISDGTAPRLTQQKPAQIEIFQGEENVRQLAAGYQSVRKENNSVVARAKISGGGKAGFDIEDRWKISGTVLSLNRKLSVTGTEDSTGFYSAIRLSTAPTVKWEDVNYLAPGLLYGEPHTNPRALGGSLYYNAKRFSIREDYLSAPLFGLLFHDGNWVATLDLAPNGATTMADTNGIGFDRTRTGSNAVSQYHEPLCSQFNELETCPEIYLLWFHHVPWNYKMKNGRILWDELCYHYDAGLRQVREFQKIWNQIQPYIDEQRFTEVQSKLRRQCRDAQIWKDGCLLYFQQFSRRSIPIDIEQPVYDLNDLEKMDFQR